jgi:hypothetical protein
MKEIMQTPWNIAGRLILLALLAVTNSALATLTVTTANQTGAASTYPFTPSWTVSTNASLIAGLAPSSTVGNFNVEPPNPGARNVNSLTFTTDLTINTALTGTSTTTTNTYVTCGNGSGSGSVLVYTLPASTNGYNLTNVTVFSGWADRGRDAQAYTLLYSTAADPASFIVLTNVSYNPTIAASSASVNRAIVADSAGGVIAFNVAAVKFVFSVPTVENGYAGYAAITVGGTVAASVATPALRVTTSTQTGASPFTPSYTAETPNLIAGMAPTLSPGNFTLETAGGTNVLTDGLIGVSGTVATFATCGGAGGSGSSLIYTLTNVVNGTDVTNIVLYSGWGDGGRDGQYYNVSYSTVSAPSTYNFITRVYLNPTGTSGAVANRVALSMNDGSALASAVGTIKFDFAGPPSSGSFDNGYQGFSEIIIQGKDTAAPPPPPSPILAQDALPGYAETFVGDQISFTAAYSTTPPISLQWQQVTTSPVGTNNINAGVVNTTNGGVVTSTLTLNNLQLTDSGSYRLKADNGTNNGASPTFTTPAPLVISTNPAPVNNVVMQSSGESGLGPISLVNSSTNFYATWGVNTNNDLILGFPTDGSGNPGTATAGPGNYGLSQANGDPTVLADGSIGYINYWVNVGASPALVTCGSSTATPGTAMTYFLNTIAATNGFDLTNIVVYGGWGDSGRNEQKYQIQYSTVAAPGTFINLGTFDYNPNNPNGNQSATRVSLVPGTGANFAQNVAAVKFNWGLQGSPPKNGYEGYSEIVIAGIVSTGTKPSLTNDVILTADDVQGSTLTLAAGFSGATGYQWQKNGTNISGANSPTLVLNNLQLSDTATNGGYKLIASNGAGSTATRECAVTVNPTPAAAGNVVIAFAHQTSDADSFTPTWGTSDFALSLISGMFPSSQGAGNFNDPDVNPASQNLAGGVTVLTDGGYGAIVDGGPHPAFATCGNAAGQFVSYTLSPSTYGYTITNILISSGWNDSGRDDEWATILYSTYENPTTFIPLAVVTNKPVVNNKSVTRAILTAPSGVLASNVYAIYVDFTTPPGVENGYVGISQINVYGTPSTGSTIPIVVTTENQNTDTPSWVIETPNLIGGKLPSSTGPGAFAGGFNGELVTEGLPALTDGTFGPAGFGTTNFATCGGAFGAGQSVTYASAGWNLTNIVVYSGWTNPDRDGQFYNIYYTTLSAPSTPVLLQMVSFNPVVGSGPQANRVQLSPANGSVVLATNVYSVTFDFSPQTGGLDNGYSGYAEIVLQGDSLAPPTPPIVHAAGISGGNFIVTGTGGTPNRGYTWLTTTNVSMPLSNWVVGGAGVLDNSGAFSNAIPVNSSNRAAFYRLRMP